MAVNVFDKSLYSTESRSVVIFGVLDIYIPNTYWVNRKRINLDFGYKSNWESLIGRGSHHGLWSPKVLLVSL